MIGMNGERDSGKSVLAVRLDDDGNIPKFAIFLQQINKKILSTRYEYLIVKDVIILPLQMNRLQKGKLITEK